jgi:glycosyltransferase involved in cell wall biosynthesis
MAEVVVMVTSSYPRFPGDSVGTFLEPIAHSVAALGHDVHVVAPWHPLVRRAPAEGRVRFHFYRYAPLASLYVFGYAGAMRDDVSLRAAAWAAAPLALAAGWREARRVARQHRATVMHAHWVVPGGFTAALAAPGLPLVVSLHGSDVYVAEKVALARTATRATFRRAGFVTACSDDLAVRAIALGADPARLETVPYGVDPGRFRPDPSSRRTLRAEMAGGRDAPVVFAAGRLVRKKGFEYLIDAMRGVPGAVLVLAGAGTLADELRARAGRAGVSDRIRFLGNVPQDRVAACLSAADVVAIPSVRDEAGNVDGLPNIVLEALAAGAPLVTTGAGGIGAVARPDETAFVVPEHDADALAAAIRRVLADPEAARRVGNAGRSLVEAEFGWPRVASRFERAYARALAFKSSKR